MKRYCKAFGMAVVLSYMPCAKSSAQSNTSENYITTTVFCNEAGTLKRTSTDYYDGLGRKRLSVVDFGGGDNNSIAQRTDYDRRGNIQNEWLPVPGGAELIDQKKFTTAASAIYGSSEIPYTQYKYEESALNRMTEENGPGALWKSHGKKVEWHKNEESGKYSCLQFTFGATPRGLELPGGSDITLNALYVKGTYPVGSLRLESTTDEDGKVIITFKDRLDRMILQRVIPTGRTQAYADTYFIYDNAGDLRYAISPEGSMRLPSSGAVAMNLLNDYAQQYSYDLQHRCISAKAPGCEATEYVYDKLNRIIFESTATQRKAGEWTLTKYDSHFRPAVKGIISLPGQTRQSLQNTYGRNLIEVDPDINSSGFESQLGYPKTLGLEAFQPYIAWMYDNYDFIVSPNDAEKNYFVNSTDKYTQNGQCTGIIMKTALNGGVYIRASKYDHRGDVIRECMWDLNLHEIRLTTEYEYDFVGNMTRRKEKYEEMIEPDYVSAQHIAITEHTYDINGRIRTSTVSVDGTTPIVIQNFKYDEIGRLSEDTSGSGISYGYDVRSNITDITSPVFSQKTWFGHSPSDGKISYLCANAAQFSWGTANKYSHTETYQYDGFGQFSTMTSDNGKVAESMTANRNADVVNILRKYRGDVVQDAAIVMDGCKAVAVNEASGDNNSAWAEDVANFSPGSYTLEYDADGRLIKDVTRDIASISYHPFGNLPQKMQTSDGSYSLSTYFPDGTLYERLFSSRTIETVTKVDSKGDTIRSERIKTTNSKYQYCGNFERTPQGWIYHTATGHYDFKNKAHYWHVRDRLGSTMAVVDAAGNIMQTNGYYPSGTPYKLPTDVLATDMDEATDELHIGNRWIGHKGLDLYDNTARMHDPLLARFHTPDPLYKKYPSLSPWSHCAANPINIIDTSGEDICVLYKPEHLAMLIQNKSGKWEYYSVNGNNVYVSGKFSGGRKFNDVGVGSWDSPQEFLDSDYNKRTDEGQDSSEENYYGFKYGYTIQSTPEQDARMRREFTRIADTDYHLLDNNCATAVQKTLLKGSIPISGSTFLLSLATDMINWKPNLTLGLSLGDIKTLPIRAFESIIVWNPEGNACVKNLQSK